MYAKELDGIPADISLLFNNVHIRFYKSHELNGFFYCTFAVPAFKDDEGYVLELDFVSSQVTEEDEDFLSVLQAPLNDHSFASLPKAVTCSFEEKIEMGQRMLLFNMQIKGTPFIGYVLISENLYEDVKI